MIESVTRRLIESLPDVLSSNSNSAFVAVANLVNPERLAEKVNGVRDEREVTIVPVVAPVVHFLLSLRQAAGWYGSRGKGETSQGGLRVGDEVWIDLTKDDARGVALRARLATALGFEGLL